MVAHLHATALFWIGFSVLILPCARSLDFTVLCRWTVLVLLIHTPCPFAFPVLWITGLRSIAIMDRLCASRFAVQSQFIFLLIGLHARYQLCQFLIVVVVAFGSAFLVNRGCAYLLRAVHLFWFVWITVLHAHCARFVLFSRSLFLRRFRSCCTCSFFYGYAVTILITFCHVLHVCTLHCRLRCRSLRSVARRSSRSFHLCVWSR